MHADEQGVGVMAEGTRKETPEFLENFRDFLALQMEAEQISQAGIARVLGMTQGAVSKRLAKIPEHVRRQVGAQPLGFLRP